MLVVVAIDTLSTQLVARSALSRPWTDNVGVYDIFNIYTAYMRYFALVFSSAYFLTHFFGKGVRFERRKSGVRGAGIES